MPIQPTLVIHGGAGSKRLAPAQKIEIERSLEQILRECYALLEQGKDALEVVTQAALRLEDDPLYNAGRGSKIQRDGHIRMSAAIMDGARRRFGGCVNVEGVKNPVLLARALMGENDRTLSGPGARKFAREIGLRFASPFTERAMAEYKARRAGKSGTIGAVALDRRGRLAAATSTGGRGFEYPGRVSDSPTVAGNFATRSSAVSATGTGEEIVECAAAARVCSYVEAGWPLNKAVAHLLKHAKKAGGDFGLIALDNRGRIAARSNTPLLIWGSASAKGLSILGRKI